MPVENLKLHSMSAESYLQSDQGPIVGDSCGSVVYCVVCLHPTSSQIPIHCQRAVCCMQIGALVCQGSHTYEECLSINLEKEHLMHWYGLRRRLGKETLNLRTAASELTPPLPQ